MPANGPAEECSRALIETVPRVMRTIREEMRRDSAPLLSIPQLRTLAYLHSAPGSCLFRLADHLGVSRPTASTIVDRLVRRKMIARRIDPSERRRVILTLTPLGARHLGRARKSTQARLASILATLSPSALKRMREALVLMGQAFQDVVDGRGLVERRDERDAHVSVGAKNPRPSLARPARQSAGAGTSRRVEGGDGPASASARQVVPRKLLGLAPIFLLLGAAALAACSRDPGQTQAKAAVAREAVPVMIETVASKAMPLQVKSIGTVQAFASVTVKSQVDGEIAGVHITDGQEVKKGDLLFTLDQRPFAAALRQAEANLARDAAQLQQAEAALAQTGAAEKQALANLARDRAQLDNATAQANRYRSLLEEGAISKELHDQVQTTATALHATLQADQAAVENARASIRAAQATVESVRSVIRADQAAVENARVQLGYTAIRAPMDGRAGNLLARVGSAAKARDDTAQLVVLNQFHPIYVSFAVPEQRLADIRRYWTGSSLKVEALVPDQPRPARGELSFINNTVDTTTATIQLKATFSNREGILWPGQFVNVVMTLTVQPDRLVVPTRAVQSGQRGQFVFVVRPDMTVESRPVVVARAGDLESVIEKGVTAGERVVTDGQLRLVPGARVQVKTAAPGAGDGATNGGAAR